MDIVKSDVQHPIGNVQATPTTPGAKQSVAPDMTNSGQMQGGSTDGANQKSMATGPGKKTGAI